MIDLFEPAGRRALQGALDAQALLGFDFDGTLAPIQARPETVAMDAHSAAAFAALAARRPVAVITGRSVADVRPRLAGTPRWVIGNHGAEGMPGADAQALAAHARVCAAWRAQLAGLLAGAAPGIAVEDKTYTLSLHYRQAGDPTGAERLLMEQMAKLAPAPHVVTGKCVFNLAPAGAPDKFVALQALVQRAGSGAAFFIGDDVTDESVFRRAPPSWVTVKVGPEPSAAHFRVRDQAAVADALELLLALAGASAVS